MSISPVYIGATNIAGSGSGPGVSSSIFFSTDAGKIEKMQEDGTSEWVFSASGSGPSGSSYVDVSKNLFTYSSDGSRYNRRIDRDGNQVWRSRFPTIAEEDIAEGGNFVYVGTGSTLRQLSKQNGNQQWSVTLDNEIKGLDADNGGAAYVGEDDNLIRKYDVNGNPDWEFTGMFDNVRDIDYSQGHVYAITESNFVRKVNASNGMEDWNFSIGEPRKTATDSSQNVYVFGKQTVKKYDSNANLVWEIFSFGSAGNFLGIDNVTDGDVTQDRKPMFVNQDSRITQLDTDGTFLNEIRNEPNRVLSISVK